MTYHLSNYASLLRDRINRMYPGRDKASDGWIGDAAHSARKSDHNPDTDGVVRAIDIDADLKPGEKGKVSAYRLADTIRHEAIIGKQPVSYIIFAGRIASARAGWKWRKYNGLNPHNHHIHISFRKALGE